MTRRKLPEVRKFQKDPEFGFEEPEHIPVGKVTLRQALQFIVKHQEEPQKYTAEKLAQDYKIDTEKLRHVLKHFQTFQLHLSKGFRENNPRVMKRLNKESKSGEPAIYRLAASSAINVDKKSEKQEKTEDKQEKEDLIYVEKDHEEKYHELQEKTSSDDMIIEDDEKLKKNLQK